MQARDVSYILANSPAAFARELAAPVFAAHEVTVIREPMKTLVMVRMRETVAGAAFYLGEVLASEALVEVAGQKGFALLMGDDLDKALAAAAIDAFRKTDFPAAREIECALEKRGTEITAGKRREIRMHQKSRVQFNTLDTSY